MASTPLDHHIYNQLLGKLLRRPSRLQPFIKLSVKIQEEDYDQFGLIFLSYQIPFLLMLWQTWDVRAAWRDPNSIRN